MVYLADRALSEEWRGQEAIWEAPAMEATDKLVMEEDEVGKKSVHGFINGHNYYPYIGYVTFRRMGNGGEYRLRFGHQAGGG